MWLVLWSLDHSPLCGWSSNPGTRCLGTCNCDAPVQSPNCPGSISSKRPVPGKLQT